ncbi:hypothetical protein EES41_02305 [Streptomyces sp. ADI95-16]|uniref:hypothetical protein n=1 Tax=Streptomyces sp. ADI95-16 TaxID=1522758 RepID=UPI000F430102|nr:hypothetical protein [Streptomyces sp. ADI95-16]AYV25563.1 hypothetical protein EES41_02305 [Streptomyces sp. ADI95-16]
MEKHARMAMGNPERSSAGISARAYWCEVLAEGEVYGTRETVPYVLGTFQTISPKLALRWLRSEAERIADRLDPDPARSAWVMPWMRVDPVPVPDTPAELRIWAEHPEEQQEARDQLKEGAPFSVVVPDKGCRFTLSVWPVAVPPPESSPTLPADDGQSTCPRSGRTSHRKARRTSGWLIPFL